MDDVKNSSSRYSNIFITRLDVYNMLTFIAPGVSLRKAMARSVVGLKAEGRIDDRIIMGTRRHMLTLSDIYQFFIWNATNTKLIASSIHSSPLGLFPESVLFRFFMSLPTRTSLVSRSTVCSTWDLLFNYPGKSSTNHFVHCPSMAQGLPRAMPETRNIVRISSKFVPNPEKFTPNFGEKLSALANGSSFDFFEEEAKSTKPKPRPTRRKHALRKES